MKPPKCHGSIIFLAVALVTTPQCPLGGKDVGANTIGVTSKNK